MELVQKIPDTEKDKMQVLELANKWVTPSLEKN